MTAHKHVEMIKAKADNMELVVFAKSLKWHEVDSDDFQFFNQHEEYFLCLPQHKEACLHWLSGGLTEVKSNLTDGDWSECVNPKQPFWRDGIGWTREDANYRIKPRKEKRWIAFNHNNGNVYGTFANEKDCANAWPALQRFEIEVEV